MQELQQELAMHDAMAGRKDMAYAPYSEAQRAQLQQQVGPQALDTQAPQQC